MRAKATVAAICLLAVPGLAQAQPGAGPTELMSKIAVTNFDRAADFYTRHIGMEKGTLYNPHEMGMEFPGGKSHPIVFYLDTCAEPAAGPASQILGPDACKNGFHAGTSWVMIGHRDIPGVASRLKATGYPFTTMPATGEARYLIVKDPDGNILELTRRP